MPTRRPPSSSRPPSRPVNHRRTARWDGRAQERPLTDAEAALLAERRQQLARALGVLIGLPALLLYLYLPNRMIQTVLDVPPQLRRFGVFGASLLMRLYPWCQFVALVVLTVLLLHLCLAAALLILQRHRRMRAT